MVGRLSRVEGTSRAQFEVLKEENHVHSLQGHPNHCGSHLHADLLLIQRRVSLRISTSMAEFHIRYSLLLIFRSVGSLLVLYSSSACDLLLIMLALLWTSQSATLLSADITSVGAVTASV